LSYKITLSTRDNKDFSFDCEANQTVQEAAEAANYFPPFGCKSGVCGACAGHCDKGNYALDNYNDAVLDKESAACGDLLLCRTTPQSDLNISVPYNADSIQQTLIPTREAEIIAIDKIAERTLQLTLQLAEDPETGLAFEFESGQFVELEIPQSDLQRAYSIANVSNWEGRLEFLIRLQPNGQFCDFLEHATIGQTLLVHAPSGSFVIDKQSTRPRCFIAGGTGLAPFMSMLRHMAEWSEDHPTHLILGVNTEAEIFCEAELTQLQASLPQLSVEICVWKPENNWQGFIGTPVDAFNAYLAKNEIECDLYLCGPPVLVEFSMQAAKTAGIPDNHIYSERFA